MERGFKGVWISRDIWLSKELTLQEKVFLVEIDSLDNEKGCYASNQHFAEFFDLSRNRCSEVIKSLEKKGFINIEYIREEGKKNIKERIIKVVKETDQVILKSNEGNRESEEGSRKVEGGIRETDRPVRKVEEGYSGNWEDNNTLLNNTVNNTEEVVVEEKTATAADEKISNGEDDKNFDSIGADPISQRSTNSKDIKSKEGDLKRIENYYLHEVRKRTICNARDMMNIVKVYEAYEDMDFILNVLKIATENNISRNGECKIKSFSYFIPILEEHWEYRNMEVGKDRLLKRPKSNTTNYGNIKDYGW